MNFTHLLSFITVVEKKSFSIAAGICNLTQSAVSQHIKALEEEYGTTLLFRNTHNISLTESGELLYRYGKRIMKEIGDCQEHISNLNNCLTGELNIGVGSFIEPYIKMAGYIMMRKYPGIRLNVDFGKSKVLNKKLRDHTLDLAFTMNTAYVDEGIESAPCIPLRIYAIMNKSHALSKRDIIDYEDIVKYPVALPDAGDRVYTTIQKHMECDLKRLKVRVVINSAEALLNSCEEMKLISFMPKQFVSNRPDLVAIPIDGLGELKSNVHWMKDTSMKKSAEMFIKIMNDEVMPYFKAIGNN